MRTEKNILLAFLLNLLFSIIEFIGGIITNSVAIISDSIHDMGDAFSIGVAYFLERKSMNKPDEYYTYGYIKYSVLGSIITAFILLTGSILVIYNAILRFFSPVKINYNGMIIFSILGVVINFFAVYFTKNGNSLNQKLVNLHMLEDVLGWLVVLFGAIIMKFTDISIIDPLLSIGVSLFVLVNSLKMLKEIINIFLEKTPNNISVKELKNHLLEINGVVDVHHIHVRSIDGFNNYATMHIVVEGNYKEVKKKVKEELTKHNIGHSTLEFEDEGEDCDSKSCEIKKIEHSHHHHSH